MAFLVKSKPGSGMNQPAVYNDSHSFPSESILQETSHSLSPEILEF